MIKVRCIDNLVERGRLPITIGKIYSVVDEIDSFYTIINDNGKEWDYLKYRFEEVKEMGKEKVLEIEFQDVFGKVAWRIAYQNDNVLKRGYLYDDEIHVVSCEYPDYRNDTLMIRGKDMQQDNKICIVSKKVAEKIKQIVYLINEKYGIPKRWRADIGEAYYYIDSCGIIVAKKENGTTTDDKRYEFGNYFKTKKELSDDKIRKIQSIIIGG